MAENVQLKNRLERLEHHLREENELLLDVVKEFYELDKVGYKIGLLDSGQSFTDRIAWWPVIAIMGMFSAGKSSFINYYLGNTLQRTGVQATDDKFTVVTYSQDVRPAVLPGIALDSDPRFPLYRISSRLGAEGGQRVDAYLQLKTCPSERLRGKILIDTPGFDADVQPDAVIAIARHVIEHSDLVMVFFDARHPEPGAMPNTLEHLVAATIKRPDADKFLYVLNQIDVAAKDDNPEDVVATWQRSLAQAGLTTGRFYRIYNPDVAAPIDNPTTRERFEKKRDIDLKEIIERMQHVRVDRSYRIVHLLGQTAHGMEERLVGTLREGLRRWRTRVIRTEVVLVLALVVLLGGLSMVAEDPYNPWHWLERAGSYASISMEALGLTGIVTVAVLLLLHLLIAAQAGKAVNRALEREIDDEENRDGLLRAFGRNLTLWRALTLYFVREPHGWNNAARRRIERVLDRVNVYMQQLNDRFANPSGQKESQDKRTT